MEILNLNFKRKSVRYSANGHFCVCGYALMGIITPINHTLLLFEVDYHFI
jgi:hypothetical protein